MIKWFLKNSWEIYLHSYERQKNSHIFVQLYNIVFLHMLKYF